MNTKQILLTLGLLTITTQSIFAGPEEDKALLVAAVKGDIVVVQTALEKGANINAQDEDGNTALMHAAWSRMSYVQAQYRYSEIVKALLAVPGININIQNDNGWNALGCAVHSGNSKMVEAFFTVPEINVNAQDKSGNTALMRAAESCNDAEIAKILLTMPGIDVNVQDKRGWTALMNAVMATYSDNTEFVKILLAVPGIDLTLKTYDDKDLKIYSYEKFPNLAHKTALDLAEKLELVYAKPEIKKLIQDALDKQATEKKVETETQTPVTASVPGQTPVVSTTPAATPAN